MEKGKIPKKNLIYFAPDFLYLNFENPSVKHLYGKYLDKLFKRLNPKSLKAIITPLLLKEESFWKQVYHLHCICHAGQLEGKNYKYLHRKQTRDKAEQLLEAITQGFNQFIFPKIKRRGRPPKDTPEWVFELHDKLTKRLTREIGRPPRTQIKSLTNFLKSILPGILGESLNPLPQKPSIKHWASLPCHKISNEIIRYHLTQKGKTNIAIDKRTFEKRLIIKEMEEQQKRDITFFREIDSDKNR
uniref:Uncharacterized protein n=1 Tax=candidate division WWE3 bacterium TaxID=2053526 RepID=A0A7C4TJS0_UNCKA